MNIYEQKKIGEYVSNEIDLKNKRFLKGPNVHALFPVLEARVDLGEWVETPSNEEFSKKLVELFPGLKDHTCSKGYEGGFIERLNEGTYPAHIVEHVAIAIQNYVGVDVSFGKSRRDEGSVYKIVMEYEYPSLASKALEGSIDLVNKLLRGDDNLKGFVNDILEEAEDALLDEKIGPSTRAILDAAEEKDIPYQRTDDKYSLFSLGWGKNKKLIWGPETSETSLIGTEVAQEKDICKDFLYDHGIPVPRGEVVTSEREALEMAEYVGYPVVLKPVSGNHGDGVFVDIKNPDELTEAYSLTKKYEDYQLVEKYLGGDDYRALIVNNEMIALAQRKPAHVIGDGSSTIKELVELTNKDPKRGEEHEKPLTKISLDEEVMVHLERQGLTTDYIPDQGEEVELTETANISSGGTAEDFTADVHPSLKRMLERVSKIIDLDLMGVDFIAEDITKCADKMNWGVIEINASPGLRMHTTPSSGESQPVGKEIIDHLYPSGEGRIPIVAITGTNGKTTTSRILEWIGRNQGHHTGLAVTGGIWSDGFKIEEGDTTGPWSANMVLQDPEVDYAVLETARGGILKRGLGFDKPMVSVVLNIRKDHIGIDGVEDREDIFWVKSLLVEVTDEDGYCVINGNDDFAERLIEKSKGTVVLFGLEKNSLIKEHIEEGGEAFVYEENELVAYLKEKGRKKIAKVKDLSYLRGGVETLIENTLAAIAAGYASGLNLDNFKNALEEFKTDEETTPGRYNVFEVEDRKIVIDYAHNPDGLESLGDFTEKISDGHRKILIFTALGDRPDSSIRKTGEVAAKKFDEQIFTEKEDLMRGRETGEITALLKEGSLSEDDKPVIINDRMEALSFGLNKSRPDDIIVCANIDLTSAHLDQVIETEVDIGEKESKKIEDENVSFLSSNIPSDEIQ